MNIAKIAGFGFIAAIVINLAFFGGVIYFAFWCAKHFGVIG
jgi:hypothetical protein